MLLRLKKQHNASSCKLLKTGRKKTESSMTHLRCLSGSNRCRKDKCICSVAWDRRHWARQGSHICRTIGSVSLPPFFSCDSGMERQDFFIIERKADTLQVSEKRGRKKGSSQQARNLNQKEKRKTWQKRLSRQMTDQSCLLLVIVFSK